MTTRSKQLYCGTANVPTLAAYTVPAGRVTILRSWQYLQTDAVAAFVGVTVRSGGVDIFLEPFSLALAQFGWLSSDRWHVMSAGDVLRVLNFSGTPNGQFMASGAELVL